MNIYIYNMVLVEFLVFFWWFCVFMMVFKRFGYGFIGFLVFNAFGCVGSKGIGFGSLEIIVLHMFFFLWCSFIFSMVSYHFFLFL